jgi:hypothetical protein
LSNVPACAYVRANYGAQRNLNQDWYRNTLIFPQLVALTEYNFVQDWNRNTLIFPQLVALTEYNFVQDWNRNTLIFPQLVALTEYNFVLINLPSPNYLKNPRVI